MKVSYLAGIFLFCLLVGIIIAFYPIIIFLILGIFFLIDGMLSLFSPSLIWMIKIANKLHGVQTNITKSTIGWWKFMGFLFIFVGFIFLYIFFAGKGVEFLG